MALDPLTAGAGLLSSGLNYLSTQKTNEMNKDLMQQQMQWQENMMDKQNALQDPVYQASRLRAAGINPALSTTGDTPIRPMDAAGVAGVQPAPMQAPQFDLAGAFSQAFQNSKTDAERNLTEKNAEVVAPLAEALIKLQGKQGDNLDAQGKLFLSQIGLNKAKTDESIASTLEAFTRIRNMDDEHAMNYWRQKIVISDANHRDAKNMSEIGLNHSEIEKNLSAKIEYLSQSSLNKALAGESAERANKEHYLAWQAKVGSWMANMDFDFLSKNPLALEGRHYASFLNVTQVRVNDKGGLEGMWNAMNPLQASMKEYIDSKNKREDIELKYRMTKDGIEFFTDRIDHFQDNMFRKLDIIGNVFSGGATGGLKPTTQNIRLRPQPMRY